MTGIENIPVPARGGSAADTAAAALRSAILRGDLAPDAPLRQDALARHFGTSHIPVREALRLLVSEGLAVAQPHRGVRVAAMSADEALELTELRALIEGHLMAVAVGHMDDGDIAVAEETLGELDATRDAAWDVDRLLVLHGVFHERLYAAARRPRALDLATSLRYAFERYLRHVWLHTDYRAQSSGEHWALLEFCRRRDASAAVELLERHIRATGETVVAALEREAAQVVKTVS